MARKKPGNSEFTAFDVFYEDGTRSSNRRIANAELGDLDGDVVVRALIEAQDQKVAALSGRPRAAIRSIVRSDGRQVPPR
jgi:hypothetical protein